MTATISIRVKPFGVVRRRIIAGCRSCRGCRRRADSALRAPSPLPRRQPAPARSLRSSGRLPPGRVRRWCARLRPRRSLRPRRHERRSGAAARRRRPGPAPPSRLGPGITSGVSVRSALRRERALPRRWPARAFLFRNLDRESRHLDVDPEIVEFAFLVSQRRRAAGFDLPSRSPPERRVGDQRRFDASPRFAFALQAMIPLDASVVYESAEDRHGGHHLEQRERARVSSVMHHLHGVRERFQLDAHHAVPVRVGDQDRGRRPRRRPG